MLKTTFLTVSALALIACFKGEAGSGSSRSDVRPVSGFSKVNASGLLKVSIERGPKPQVIVDADDNLLPMIITKVEGDRLELYTKGEMRPSRTIAIRVIMDQPLEELSASGACKITAKQLEGPRLEVDLSGAVKATLSGAVEKLELDASGAVKVDALELSAAKVELEGSGAVTAQVHAKDALEVKLSGACQARYKGQPKVEKRLSGASSLKPL